MRVSNLTAEESRASRHLTIVKLRGKRFFARRGLEEKRRRRRSRQADKLTPRSVHSLTFFLRFFSRPSSRKVITKREIRACAPISK